MPKVEKAKLQLAEYNPNFNMLFFKKNISISLITVAFRIMRHMLHIRPVYVEESWCLVKGTIQEIRFITSSCRKYGKSLLTVPHLEVCHTLTTWSWSCCAQWACTLSVWSILVVSGDTHVTWLPNFKSPGHTLAILILVFQTPARYIRRKIILQRWAGWRQEDIEMKVRNYPAWFRVDALRLLLTNSALQRNKQFPCSSWKLVLYSHNKLLFQQSKHSPTGKHYRLKQILFHACESNLQSFS